MELITKLLKMMHGQWLYQNVQVHDKVVGTLATLRKEEIYMKIDEQQALGTIRIAICFTTNSYK